MLCEECNQRPAEVVVTTVIGGESITRHLCRECVKKYQTGDISALLAALLASMSHAQQNIPDIRCPHCGETLAEFRKSGMLGCAQCYQAFRDELTPLLTRIQGRAQHAGRRPPVSAQEQARLEKMESLRKEMEEAVTAENFEKAAALRDELKALKEAKPAQDVGEQAAASSERPDEEGDAHA